MKRFALYVAHLLLAVFLVMPSARAQGGAVVEYVALLGLLQNLRSNLDGVINTVNQDTADRIRQLEIAIDNSIGRVQETIKQVNAGISVQREEIFRQTFDTLALANHELQSSSRMVFLEANKSLVHASTIIGSLPFVRIPDYIFAADPPRLSPKSFDRLISFYGYFPNVKGDGDAYVELAGVTFPLRRHAGFKLAFELPTKFIQREQTYLDMTIRLPRPTYTTLFRPAISNRVYVERVQPFTFEIRTLTANPALWRSLGAPSAYSDRADSGKTSVRKTLKAADLFSLLVNNDRDFDMSSALLEAVTPTVTPGGKPCDCCDGPTGKLERWQASELEYSLYAPTCGDKMCSLTYHCGGGGTNVSISIACSFKVKVRNVPETVVAGTQSAVFGKGESRVIKVGNVWSAIQLIGRFQDGDEKLENSVIVKRDVPVGSSPLYTARHDGADGILIETRR
jgi:hypothetical protein